MLAGPAAGVGQAGLLVDDRQRHAGRRFSAIGSARMAPVGQTWPQLVQVGSQPDQLATTRGRPQAVKAVLAARRLEDVVGAGLEALAAADAQLQEGFLGNTAGGAYGRGAGAPLPMAAPDLSRPRLRRRVNEEAAARAGRGCFRGMGVLFRAAPSGGELNRVGRADAAAGLAKAAPCVAGEKSSRIAAKSQACLHRPQLVQAAVVLRRVRLSIAPSENIAPVGQRYLHQKRRSIRQVATMAVKIASEIPVAGVHGGHEVPAFEQPVWAGPAIRSMARVQTAIAATKPESRTPKAAAMSTVARMM